MAPLPFQPEHLFLGIVFTIGVIILVIHVLKSKSKYEQFNSVKPVFYMFYTEWCGYSQKMLPVWDLLPKQLVKRIKVKDEAGKILTDKKLEDIIEFKKINCEENETTRKMCQDFKVKYLPTLIFMKGNGEPELYRGAADLNLLFEFTENQMLK